MFQSRILIPQKIYQSIHKHLFPKKIKSERVAFIFTAVNKLNNSILFEFKSLYLVKSEEYESQSLGYVELQDEMRPKIIKMAFDLDAAIVEIHSHPYLRQAEFSPSDIRGLNEFVPHVWWRLKGKPYAAIVFSKIDFDALVWIDSPKKTQQLTKIEVEGEYLYPNGITLSKRHKKYDYKSF